MAAIGSPGCTLRNYVLVSHFELKYAIRLQLTCLYLSSISQAFTETKTLARIYFNQVKLLMQNLLLLTEVIYKDVPSSSSEI